MSTSIFTKAFWQATAERAAKSAAQGAVLAIGADQINILTLHLETVGGFAAGAALLSVLTSIISGGVTGQPSLGGEVVESMVVAQTGNSVQAPVVAGPASPITDGTPVAVTSNGA